MRIAARLHPALKRYNNLVRIAVSILSLALVTTFSLAQEAPNQDTSDKASAEKARERNREAEESSSRDTKIDIRPPRDDAKSHPNSAAAISDLGGEKKPANQPDDSGIQEFHPWNPLKARKDIEVGDFYFRRKNYKAALERYKEALYYKDGDAIANFRVAECQEKLGDKDEAKKYYAQYLKILPEGPLAKDAQASLDRLAKSASAFH